MALQADGKLILGGSFTAIGSTPRRGLARLNANGVLTINLIDRVGEPTHEAVERILSFLSERLR